MKKFFFSLLFVVFFCPILRAQVNVFNTAGGNVGIGTGTTPPAARLQIVTSGAISNVFIDYGTTTKFKLETGNGYHTLGTTTQHPLIFATNNVERIRILSDNNDAGLRIGLSTTTNKSAYLDFVGDNVNPSYGLRILRGNTGANAASTISHRGTGDFVINLENNANFYHKINNKPRLYHSGNQSFSYYYDEGHIFGGGGGSNVRYMSLGGGRTDPGDAYFDLVGQEISGGNVRLYRSAGTSGIFSINNSGSGDFNLNTGGNYNISTNTTTRLAILSNGNVGVGTTAPRAKFDVGSTSENTLTTVLGRLGELDGNGEGTFLGVRALNTQPINANSFSIEHKFNNSLNSSINFFRGNSFNDGFLTFATNNGTERMRIASNGNVGIGTATPVAALDLRGDKLLISGNNSSTGGIAVFNGLLGVNADEVLANYGLSLRMKNLEIRTGVAGNLTGNLNASIDNAGNAFFGGNVDLSGKLLINAPYINGIGSQINLGATGRSGGQSSWSIYNMQGGGPYGGGFQIWSYPADGQSYGGCCNYRFGITEDGRVNIGNITGSIAYSNDYKLAVNGNIITQKVRVTQTGWADYVFEEKYPLLPLPELNQFIKSNKHLPEIPTEKEVSENGLDLGDMNALLLKKVEELTLYVIDLQKQVDQLKKDSKKKSRD